MQDSHMVAKVTLYSVDRGIVKKYSGTVHKIPWTDRGTFISDTKPVYMVNCSGKSGVIYGRTTWFEEDNAENAKHVIEAFKEKYAGQINDFQKRIKMLNMYLSSTWKII